MAWTEERVKKLTLLWKSGNSASKIALELGEGVSRNAVIGKIHRLGLSERGSGLGPKGTKKSSKNQSDDLSTSDKSPNDLISDPKFEQSEKRKGKKRGRKPSIKKLISNEGSSDSISKINYSPSTESDVIEIEKNCEYVGENFEKEARAIYFGDSPERSIYGKTTLKEAKSLYEDGIPVTPLPWIDRKTN